MTDQNTGARKPMNGESTEIYYAEMEAARNEAEDAYFNARPQLADTIYARALFREGFERGFRMAWERTTIRALLKERDALAAKVASYERADRDLNEALNMGDGSYRP